MPLIKTIASSKSKGYHSLEDMREWRRKKKSASKSNGTWYGGSKSNVVKAKNGRVKKVTKLTSAFVSAASGKKVNVSSKPKLL